MDLLFSSLSIKRLSYLILVAITAFFVKSMTANPQAYWLIWSAFLLSLVTTGDSFKRRLNTIIITGLASGFVAFAAGYLNIVPLLLAFYLFIVTAVCVYVGQRKPDYFLQACMINLFAILSASSDVSFAANSDRLDFICLGVAIAALLQMLFYPYFIRNELQLHSLNLKA